MCVHMKHVKSFEDLFFNDLRIRNCKSKYKG